MSRQEAFNIGRDETPVIFCGAFGLLGPLEAWLFATPSVSAEDVLAKLLAATLDGDPPVAPLSADDQDDPPALAPSPHP